MPPGPYCLDASTIIHAWVATYPPDVAPALWEYVEEAIADGSLVSPQDVREELKYPEDLKKWAKRHDEMFRELEPPVVVSLKEVLEWARNRISAQGIHFRPQDLKADPIVVALARVAGATVVCEEFPPRGAQGRPKIPDYCNQFSIRCINTLELIREMGWRFSRQS